MKVGDAGPTGIEMFSYFQSLSCGNYGSDGFLINYDIPLTSSKEDYKFFAKVDGNPKEYTYDNIPLNDVEKYMKDKILI